MSTDAPRRPLGQILITQGILTEDQLRIALLEQMKANQPIGKLLVSLGFVSEATLRDALSESLGRQSIDLSNAIVDPPALKLVPRDVAKRHHLLPLDYDEASQRLTLAASDTHNIVALDKVRSLLPEHVEIDTLLAGESEIDRAIDQYYGYELSIDGILHEIETGEIDYAEPAGVRRRVQPAGGAPDRRAAHRRGEARRLRHPLRAGSRLPAHPLPHRRRAAADPRAAQDVLAGDGGAHQGDDGMNIAETRAPQDGRISLTLSRPPGRFPRRRAADHPRREHRAAHPRPPEGHRAARGSGPRRRSPAARSS